MYRVLEMRMYADLYAECLVHSFVLVLRNDCSSEYSRLNGALRLHNIIGYNY